MYSFSLCRKQLSFVNVISPVQIVKPAFSLWKILLILSGLAIGFEGLCQSSKPVIPPPAKPKEVARPLPDPGHEKKKTILAVLHKQQDDWNRGDIDGYMSGYWKSDTLRMVTNRGVTYGFDKILTNYKKSYPDSAAMGKLDFDVINVELIGEMDAMVTGKWLLKIDKKFKGGFFTLLFRKIRNRWVIVADHTS
ncbi:MAG TPA: nuclear transport factor 2 family protein [Catalimonadaceae bacterium]|nr:nuclear transport factor 2 family protein [Catalimonadaceae bacterium]